MIYRILLSAGRGVGQVMFQNNALSGVLMLAGLACGSWQAVLLALCGNAVGMLTAYAAGFDRRDIEEGLYGFNGTLVGIAVGVFLHINVWSVSLMVLGAALSSLLFRRWPWRGAIPPFTAPFILVTWGLLCLVHWLVPELLLPAAPLVPQSVPDVRGAFCRNIGQVMFQGTTSWSGALFLLGIMVNSAKGTVAAVLGAVLPLLGILMPDVGYAEYNAGLLGYNAVLAAMAMNFETRRDVLWMLLAILLSVALQFLGMHCGVITLTAPFVLAVWMTMTLRRVSNPA